ncbi:LAMI_0F02916g1_1 [Lachancea mirantina]|uniref:Pre-mRNA-splicing factor CWC25 n=1 Tax=Lachancea mirantina TaxID=1230905 RepID=A0A1G4JWZ2_9SACH|nr:LAMI_0F02916g1_1 [Lachancea mirantina]
MGTGDLNLLKSWNPHLLKNKKKVWETEQQALAEHQKIKQRQVELEKERSLDQLASMNENGTVSKRKNGLEWMYNDSPTKTSQNEDFLLGRREIDDSVLKQTKKDQQTRNVGYQDTSVKYRESSKVDASILNEDPIMAIKRRQFKKNYPSYKTI